MYTNSTRGGDCVRAAPHSVADSSQIVGAPHRSTEASIGPHNERSLPRRSGLWRTLTRHTQISRIPRLVARGAAGPERLRRRTRASRARRAGHRSIRLARPPPGQRRRPPPRSVPPTTTPVPVVTAPPETVSTGGSLVFAGNEEPDSIDAIDAVSVNAAEVVTQIFETLVYIDQQQKVYPGLALSWSDPTTPRSGPSSWWRTPSSTMARPSTPSRWSTTSSISAPPRASRAVSASALQPAIEKAEKVDDYTVKISLKSARPDFLTDLAERRRAWHRPDRPFEGAWPGCRL